jgi:uncharacterized iron-regulated membrane protein
MKRRERKTLKLHRWTGLVVGVFIVVITLSGASMTFHHEIESLVYPKVLHVEPGPKRLPVDDLLASVRRVRPDFARFSLLELPQTPGDALMVGFQESDQLTSVYLNPYTGRITGTLRDTFPRLALRLHRSFFAGLPGIVISIFCGLALLVMTSTGLVLYRKFIGKALLFRIPLRRADGSWNVHALHNVVGAWSLVFLFLMGLSGTLANLGSLDPSTRLVYTGQRPEAPLRRSLDALLAETQQRIPALQARYVYFPQLKKGPVTVMGFEGAELGGYSRVEFDPGTGRMLGVYPARETGGLRVLMALVVFHLGGWGGWPIKLAYTLLGLLAGTLPITGFLLWRRNAQSRRPPVLRPA